MARQKLTHRLAELRVSEELFNKVHQVAKAQGIDISDVQRLALEDYCTPYEPQYPVKIPIVGEIRDNHIVFYPGVDLKGISAGKVVEIGRYIEVEPMGGA